MKKISRILFWILLFTVLSGSSAAAYAKEDPVSEAKKGIIEIYTGILDKKGDFHKIKHGSGVVIYSGDRVSYLITSYKFLHISEKKIKEFCKENKISLDAYSAGSKAVVKAVVKGDVIVDTSVVAESAEKNFTVLELNNSMGEKVPVPVGNSDDLVIGSKIYALGFPEDAEEEDVKNRSTEYTYEDVVIYEGTIEDTSANKNGVSYLQHSALVNGGNKGGPILDKDGYIVGINDSSIKEEGRYFSLPINEVSAILDNYKLEYESKSKNLSLAALAKKIDECEELVKSSEYKQKSKATLQTAIEEARSLQEQGVENLDAVAVVMDDLEKGKDALVLKMTSARKMVIVLGIVDLLLLFWMFRLLVINRRWKKDLGRGKSGKDASGGKPGRTGNSPKRDPDKDDGSKPLPTNVIPDEKSMDNLYDHTMILGSENSVLKRPKAVLTILRTGEKVEIRKPSFNLGVKKELTDYAITGNPAVSRLHATISWDGENYYIADRGSANGTYVNRETVGKNQKHIIKNGDIIVLANEECVFETK